MSDTPTDPHKRLDSAEQPLIRFRLIIKQSEVKEQSPKQIERRIALAQEHVAQSARSFGVKYPIVGTIFRPWYKNRIIEVGMNADDAKPTWQEIIATGKNVEVSCYLAGAAAEPGTGVKP